MRSAGKFGCSDSTNRTGFEKNGTGLEKWSEANLKN